MFKNKISLTLSLLILGGGGASLKADPRPDNISLQDNIRSELDLPLPNPTLKDVFSQSRVLSLLQDQFVTVSNNQSKVIQYQTEYTKSLQLTDMIAQSNAITQTINKINEQINQDTQTINDLNKTTLQTNLAWYQKLINIQINELNKNKNNLKRYDSTINTTAIKLENAIKSYQNAVDNSGYWGNGIVWGFKYNGKDYGWPFAPQFVGDLKNFELYKDGINDTDKIKLYSSNQAEYDNINYAINQLQNNLTFLQETKDKIAQYDSAQNNFNSLTDILNSLTEQTTALQNKIKDLQDSIITTDSDQINKNLKDAKYTYEKSILTLGVTLNQITTLAKIQQKAISTIHSEQKTLSSLSNATYNNLSALNFSSNLATNTRLAKMSNPY
ncbi:hypothetical protein, partial [Helicobacter sp. 13S00477-4]|uniref:hypothetical protein n=1 Tax=Helicobacter sp. 13S00477-4 TaxID=1905759 RepID=UPI00117A8BD6